MTTEMLIQVESLAVHMATMTNEQLLEIMEAYGDGRYSKEQSLAACSVQQARQYAGRWFKSYEEAETARQTFQRSNV